MIDQAPVDALRDQPVPEGHHIMDGRTLDVTSPITGARLTRSACWSNVSSMAHSWSG